MKPEEKSTPTPDYMPREGVNGFTLLGSPENLVDAALQVYARTGNYPDSRVLHESAMAYRREVIRQLVERAALLAEVAELRKDKARLVEAVMDAHAHLDEATTYLAARNLGEPARLLFGKLANATALARAAINAPTRLEARP